MRVVSAVLLSLAAALSGCTTLNTVDCDVSTYSQWPLERKPATYAFERLPSQQARPQEQGQLESMARPALTAAGFQEVADAKDADITVQVGMRVSRSDRYPYYDPFWWPGGFYYPYYYPRVGRPYWGPYWGPGYWGAGYPMLYDTPRYDREVALLMRDQKTNQPLYEARAASDGWTIGSDALAATMFMAAMKDFPHTGINPRRVSIQLPG